MTGGAISRDELQIKLQRRYENVFYDVSSTDDYRAGALAFAETVMSDLLSTPTIDAVSVVRCRDCKYYNVTCCSPGFGWCERSGHNHGTTDNWFCADGRDRYD